MPPPGRRRFRLAQPGSRIVTDGMGTPVTLLGTVAREGPIGVFDSGVGGLSVLRAIRQELPSERVVYVADSGFAPYGDRDADFIEERSGTIARFLMTQGAKAIVVACNTATGVAVERLRATFHLPIVAIEPAIKPAAALTKSGVIGVLATSATIASPRFTTLARRVGDSVRLLAQPCPGLVPRVEAGDLSGGATRALVEQYTLPLVAQGVDTLVLGCTHYAFLTPVIREVVGADVTILDPAPAVARELRRRLDEAGLLRTVDAVPDRDAVAFWSSGDLHAVIRVIGQLWAPDTDVQPLPPEFTAGVALAGS